MMQKALTTKEVAEILNITVAHVDKLCAGGIIAAFKLSDKPNGKWRVMPRNLERWIAARERAAKPPREKSLVSVLKENL